MATVSLCLSPAIRGRKMTLDEFLEADIQSGFRYELAAGALEVSKIPKPWHGTIVWLLHRALVIYDLAHPGVIDRAGGAGEYQFIVPRMISGRNPDVAVTLRATPPDSDGLRPATFAVEIVSRGKRARHRDYVTKRAEYLAYGLDEYWIVDRFDRRVTILVRDGDAWAERVVTGDGSAESVVLPGLVVPLADLWAASV